MRDKTRHSPLAGEEVRGLLEGGGRMEDPVRKGGDTLEDPVRKESRRRPNEAVYYDKKQKLFKYSRDKDPDQGIAVRKLILELQTLPKPQQNKLFQVD